MNRKIGLVIGVFVSWVACSIPGDAQKAAAPKFTYAGDTGPAFWRETSPGCAPSARESPIDIEHAVEDPKLAPPLNLKTTKGPFRLNNPGYPIEGTPPPGSSTLTIETVPFALAQFHFHTLSEHTVNGTRG